MIFILLPFQFVNKNYKKRVNTNFLGFFMFEAIVY